MIRMRRVRFMQPDDRGIRVVTHLQMPDRVGAGPTGVD